jgi:hypothetical protein
MGNISHPKKLLCRNIAHPLAISAQPVRFAQGMSIFWGAIYGMWFAAIQMGFEIHSGG